MFLRGKWVSLMSPDEEAAAGGGDRGDVIEEAEAEQAEEVQAEAEQAEAEVEQAPKKASPMVPKARLDEVINKNRKREAELLAKLSKMESGTAEKTATQALDEIDKTIETLEEKYEKALEEGKSKDARAILKDIRLKERERAQAEMRALSSTTSMRAVEDMRKDMVIAQLEEDYPFLAEDHESYDQSIVDDIVAAAAGFELAGLSPSKAMAKAANQWIRANQDTVKALTGASSESESEAEGKKEEAVKKGLGRKQPADERRAEQVKKNVAAAKAAGKDAGSVGKDSDSAGGGLDAKSVSRMTEEEFNALPAGTKARLRGDFIEAESA